MELAVWTYEGPPHVGAMRIATSMEGVHYLLHAPQGDTYANLLFTMIERRKTRTPVSFTTFQARDLGGDTSDLVIQSAREAYDRFTPEALLVGESCTAELIQDQPGSLVHGMGLPVPVVPLELPAYSRKENWGASETLYHLVRTILLPLAKESKQETVAKLDVQTSEKTRPKVNLIGPSALGFRCRDDVTEIVKLLNEIGVDVAVVLPEGASVDDIRRLPEADCNCCLLPEVALTTCTWLEKHFNQPFTRTVPIGIGATEDFLREVAELTGLGKLNIDSVQDSRMPWYSKSIDSTYLTGKRVFIFGDATHVVAAARIAKHELGFEVVGIGTYSREFAREVRAMAKELELDALITDNFLEVEAKVAELQPELVLGTQMERHIAKRLGIPCAVISAPIHVQDCPARYSPQMGYEGANVIFDTWVHPLMMGLEEHLLAMFRDDFEFNDQHPSHLEGSPVAQGDDVTAKQLPVGAPVWEPEAQKELKKIPFFVRGKARRNTEVFAQELGLENISVETLYDAKAHFSN